jgi:Protein of unknown function (DUF2510)
MERQQSQPGWYKHPEDPSKEWYWDGQQWTESRPPAAAPLTGTSGWAVAGYVCAVLLPPIGLLIALVPLRNRFSPHWKRVLGISLAVIAIPIVLALALSL